MKFLKNYSLALLTFTVLSSSCAHATDFLDMTDLKDLVSPTQKNYNKTINYIADSPFHSVDGSFFKDGFIGSSANNFFKNVMGYDDAKIAEYQKNALKYFYDRFGLEPGMPGVIIKDVEVAPEMNYRVTAESGEIVPKKGFKMYDIAWVAAVVNPAGVTLGGEYAGKHVPAGTMMAYGEYLIVRPQKIGHRHVSRRSLIHYQSIKPLSPEPGGFVILACELTSKEYGDGIAMGVVTPFPLSDGRMVYNIATTLTFPRWGKEVPQGEGWRPMFYQ